MTDEREHLIVEAFVELAESLASGFDAVDLLDGLVHSCASILDVASAGLLLADELGRLHVLAATSQPARDLEVFQLQRDEGPCRDCYHTGEPVDVPELAAEVDRWPQFARRALSAGFASVHAVPLRLRSNTLGALGLFGTSTGALAEEDHRLAQALADVASVALVQERAAMDRIALSDQLQTALTSRIVLEQAKGLLAHAGDIEVTQAFDALRRFARDNNLRLTAVATAVVGRTLTSREVLEHSHSQRDR